jgi:hypothetical protein
MWRSQREWGAILYKWAQDTGNVNVVLTFFELLEGETGETQGLNGTRMVVCVHWLYVCTGIARVLPPPEFHRLDAVVFRKACLALQKEGKAQIIGGPEPDDANDGVKFL